MTLSAARFAFVRSPRLRSANGNRERTPIGFNIEMRGTAYRGSVVERSRDERVWVLTKRLDSTPLDSARDSVIERSRDDRLEE
ncbi:MAG: hypothetical protein AABZ39_11865 [Spirochaetota bacterium]